MAPCRCSASSSPSTSSDLGEPGVGTLTAAIGAGAIVGSLFASVVRGQPTAGRLVRHGRGHVGAPLVVLAAYPSRPAALALFALIGVGNALVDVGLFTLVARLAPERVLARVYGLLECIGGLFVGGGSVLAAWLASSTDLRQALWIVGAVGPALVLIFWFQLRRIDDAMVARDEDLGLLRRVAVFDPLPLPALEQLAAGPPAAPRSRRRDRLPPGRCGGRLLRHRARERRGAR